MNKKLILAATAAALLVIGGTLTYRHFHDGHAAAGAELYYCPMHPDYTSPKPGDCPICNMFLVKKETSPQKDIYYCPMHPDVTSDKPGDCPICNMHLIKKAPSAAAGGGSQVPGHGSVTLTPEKQQMIGLKTGKAAYRRLAKTINAAGSVAYDPELYRAIAEYRSAAAARDSMRESGGPDARERSAALADAARLRLLQLGFAEEQAAGGGEEAENLLLPRETMWVYAQIYEYDSAAVRPGQRAVMTSRAWPGREFEGVVRSLDPVVSDETRTLRARIETGNRGLELRPEMYVSVRIEVELGTALTVPAGAVLNTGEKELVFAMKDDGVFEPRQVRTGRRDEENIEVRSGVANGESVVTSANFLIDSESRMRAALGN